MFNNKYSKFLTVLLIVVIIAIVGLLIFLGIDAYKNYNRELETGEVLEQFDGQINNIISNQQQENIIVEIENIVIEPDVNENEIADDSNTGTGTTNQNTITYKGFNVIGKIEIPKTDIEYPILDSVSITALESSICYIYGEGINQIGNTVLVGHNYKNSAFFSNNKKLSKGDKIYITDNNGKTVTYVIYKKYETSTDDFSYATRDTEGKREISLSTCTDDTKKRLVIWAREE